MYTQYLVLFCLSKIFPTEEPSQSYPLTRPGQKMSQLQRRKNNPIRKMRACIFTHSSFYGRDSVKNKGYGLYGKNILNVTSSFYS